MSNYHTAVLEDADIFIIMGSIYAEISRYDSAIEKKQFDLADQASARAGEIIAYAGEASQLNKAQKAEIEQFKSQLLQKTMAHKKSGMDNYLLPYAVAARLRQLK